MAMSNDIVEWISQAEINQIDSAKYWNDIEVEKEKAWWIKTAQDNKLMEYLKQETNLERAFLDLINFSKTIAYDLKGVVLDLGAGTCWTSAIISRILNVRKVIAVDISRHRLEIIAPIVFEQYGADVEKITRALGSFYSIKMEANSVDCIVLVEAFHHAYNQDNFMNEITRVLKPKGVIFISGETVQTNAYYCKVIMLNIIKKIICLFRMHKLVEKYFGKAIAAPPKIFAIPFNEEMGDHYYTRNNYVRIFKKYGFDLKIQRLDYRCFGGRGRDCNFLAIKK